MHMKKLYKIKEEIENLRQELDELLNKGESFSSESLLELSNKLDSLIVKYTTLSFRTRQTRTIT